VVSLNEAQNTLPDLLERAASDTEDITIERDGKPLARLIPIPALTGQRVPGSAAGQFQIPPEFYQPFTEDELREWGL
jgi:prevent-host-death family protein